MFKPGDCVRLETGGFSSSCHTPYKPPFIRSYGGVGVDPSFPIDCNKVGICRVIELSRTSPFESYWIEDLKSGHFIHISVELISEVSSIEQLVALTDEEG